MGTGEGGNSTKAVRVRNNPNLNRQKDLVGTFVG